MGMHGSISCLFAARPQSLWGLIISWYQVHTCSRQIVPCLAWEHWVNCERDFWEKRFLGKDNQEAVMFSLRCARKGRSETMSDSLGCLVQWSQVERQWLGDFIWNGCSRSVVWLLVYILNIPQLPKTTFHPFVSQHSPSVWTVQLSSVSKI